MLSYAQIFEDVFLERCFTNKETGFYIDIGACHPVHCNTTYHFYQRGWSGINIEPTPFRLKELKRARPRDRNLGVAIGNRNGTATFNISANADHLSSLLPQSPELIESHRAQIESVDVEVLTLASLCERYAPSEIDFLKIDAEGAEGDIIAGANWAQWRPRLLVIEATVPGTPIPAWETWEPLLTAARYDCVFFDGVNRYYIASEHPEMAEYFKIPINPFDNAVAFHSFGMATYDERHPDHTWAKNFVTRLFAAASQETDDYLLKVMTWDLLDRELDGPPTKATISLAFNRVLARNPGEQDIRHWEGRTDLTLRMLYTELLIGEEFRVRRSRISIRSMWR